MFSKSIVIFQYPLSTNCNIIHEKLGTMCFGLIFTSSVIFFNPVNVFQTQFNFFNQFIFLPSLTFINCFFQLHACLFPLSRFGFKNSGLAQVVQKVDNAILWICHYPVVNAIGFLNTYPLDSDLHLADCTIQLLNNRGLFFGRFS